MTDLAPLNRIAKLHGVEPSELPLVTSPSWLNVVLPQWPRYAISEHDRGQLITVRRARTGRESGDNLTRYARP